MTDSFVQVPPNSTGGKVKTYILGDGTEVQRIALNDSSGNELAPLTDAQLRATPLNVSGVVADGSSPTANFMMVGGMTAGGVAQLFETNASGHLNIADGGGSITVDGTVSVTGVATAANQTTGNASLSSIDTKTPSLVSGRVPVDGSGVTQPVSGTFWQATQPVSAASLPLPTGAATETTLAALNAKFSALGQGTMAASQPVVIASNQSAIPITLANDVVTTYNVAGVIAINTDLLVIDCQGLEAVSIHCTSMGTTGVVTPAWSNTNVTAEYINQSIMTPAGVAAATFNAAGMWVSVKQARFLRLRLTTATTAGTTTINVLGIAQGLNFPVQVQPISGAVTVSSGTITTVSSVTSVASSTPVTPTQSFINSAATTNATSVKATAGTVWSIIASNVNAAARYVKFYNLAVAPTVGTSVPVFTITIPAGQTVQIDGGSNGIRFGTGIALAITGAMADADTTVVAANEIKVSTSYT